jgi:hypothetical protein
MGQAARTEAVTHHHPDAVTDCYEQALTALV